jgi:hypothetical protein
MQTTRLLLKAGDAADIKIANAPTEITDFITLNSLGYCCCRHAVSERCSLSMSLALPRERPSLIVDTPSNHIGFAALKGIRSAENMIVKLLFCRSL